MVFPHITCVPFLLGGLTKCGVEVERMSYRILSLLSRCLTILALHVTNMSYNIKDN